MLPTSVVLANAQPIGPAFAAVDTDGDGIIESDEPFTVAARLSGDTFCWFINGIQVGSNLTIPAGAITGVDQAVATNLIIGRNRLIWGFIPDLDVALDDLNVQAPTGSRPVLPTEVAIDIKPGGDPNSINPRSKGVIPVAILTAETFDAGTVDPSTVEFGPNGATEAHGQGHLEDVDGDGDLDLVLHFRTQATGFQCGGYRSGPHRTDLRRTGDRGRGYHQHGGMPLVWQRRRKRRPIPPGTGE